MSEEPRAKTYLDGVFDVLKQLKEQAFEQQRRFDDVAFTLNQITEICQKLEDAYRGKP